MTFDFVPEWAARFNFDAHSPSGCGRPDDLEFFEKCIARPRNMRWPGNCAMAGGRAAETAVNLATVEGEPWQNAFRSALSEFDEHESPAHIDKDRAKHSLIRDYVYTVKQSKEEKDAGAPEVSGTFFELVCHNLLTGTLEATKGANRIDDGRWVSMQFDGVELDFIGQIDLEAGAVIELKTSWPSPADTKQGFRMPSLPTAPRPEHVMQVALYRAWLHRQEQHVPVKLVYATPAGYRVFDSDSCEALGDAAMARALERMCRIARSREHLMKRAEDLDDLFAFLSPDFSHFMWRDKPPEYLELARRIFK